MKLGSILADCYLLSELAGGSKLELGNLKKLYKTEKKFGVYTNMGKQKFDRMKKTLSILVLVFLVVSVAAVATSAAPNNGGGRGGHGGWGGGFDGGFGGGWGPGFGWGGPFGFYPPAPYGTAPGSCACGPYGCFCAPDYTYLVQAIIAENGW